MLVSSPGYGRFCSVRVSEAPVISPFLAFGSTGLGWLRVCDRPGGVGAVPGGMGRGTESPSGRAALPAALKAPTMQRWRPSSVTLSPGAGEPARRGRGSREAAAVTRAPGRGGRPRAAALARSAGGPAKGRSRQPPGPAPSPAPRPEAPAAGASRARTPPPTLARRPAPRPAPRSLPSLACPPARGIGAALEAAPAGGAAAARALAHPGTPARGVRAHLAPARRCAERARRGAGASRRCGARGRRSAGERGAPGCVAGDRRWAAAGRRRVPSAPAGPAGRPAGAAQLRN